LSAFALSLMTSHAVGRCTLVCLSSGERFVRSLAVRLSQMKVTGDGRDYQRSIERSRRLQPHGSVRSADNRMDG